MPRGQYTRVSAEELARRDAELKKAGMLPDNPKLRAAAYRKLQEMKGKGEAPKKNGTKPVAKAAAPKKLPQEPKKRGPKPKAPVVAKAEHHNPELWEKRRDLNEAKTELEAVCMMRGHLGEFVSEGQNSRFSALIDWHLTRYQEALQACYPAPQEVSKPEETEVEDTDEPEAALPDVPPLPVQPTPPPRILPQSALPNPPPPPPLPPCFPKTNS